MAKFHYDVAHHRVELSVSDWTGLESLSVDGKTVSRKFNLAPQTLHTFELTNGDNCKVQLLTDTTGKHTICRFYRRDELITSLKHFSSNKAQLTMHLAILLAICGLILLTV